MPMADSPAVPWADALALSSVEGCMRMAETHSCESQQIKSLLGAVVSCDQMGFFVYLFVLLLVV